MVKEAQQSSKMEMVAEILNELGMLVDKPEKGWRSKVEEKLAERKVKVNPVTIYTVRNNLMGKGNKTKDKKPTENNGKPRVTAEITLRDVRDINDLSERFGGLAGLRRAIDEIQTVFAAK